jgi:hypothetical protein
MRVATEEPQDSGQSASLSGTRGGLPTCSYGTLAHTARCRSTHSGNIMRYLLLWFIGIPIPIIILLWLVTGHA